MNIGKLFLLVFLLLTVNQLVFASDGKSGSKALHEMAGIMMHLNHYLEFQLLLKELQQEQPQILTGTFLLAQAMEMY